MGRGVELYKRGGIYMVEEILQFISSAFGGTVTTPEQVYLILSKFNLKQVTLTDIGVGDDLLKVALALVVKLNPSQNRTIGYDELLIPEQYRTVYTSILQYQEHAKQAKQAEDALLTAIGADDTVLDQILEVLA